MRSDRVKKFTRKYKWKKEKRTKNPTLGLQRFRKLWSYSLDKSEDFNLPKCNLNSTVSCNFMPFRGKGMQVCGRCHEKARDKMPKGRSAKRKKKAYKCIFFLHPCILHDAICTPPTHIMTWIVSNVTVLCQ